MPRPLISGEDQSLWQRIAASVSPLRQAKPRVPDVEAPTPAHAQPRDQQPDGRRSQPAKPVAAAGKAFAQAAVSSPATARIPAPPPRPAHTPLPPKTPAPIPTVERRHARRLASGAIDIDARLDLHGLTQSAAHDRLLGFLRRSAAEGLRNVLVITGKGSPRTVVAWLGGRREEETGVLRRSVPRWLAEPAFRAFVVSYQAASPRHGGEGAFYIVLRRPKAGHAAR